MYMLDTNAIIMSIRHPEWQISTKIEKHLGKDLCISLSLAIRSRTVNLKWTSWKPS